jgi:hypothetical protein
MPFVEHRLGREFNTLQAPEEKKPDPGFLDTFYAGFKMENSVLNAADYASRPAFLPQDGFQVGKALREFDTANRSTLFEQYRDQFLGVQSEDEMNYKISRIREQEQNRDTLSRAGWLGVVAGVTGGLVSPEMLIPFVGEARGLKAVAQGAVLGLAASVPAETALGLNQETRTKGDIAFSLAASTALGGILGGAVGFLRSGEREIFENEITQMGSRPRGVGAEAVELPNAGGLATKTAQKVAAINDSTRLLTNPVTETINQEDFQTWRVLMQQASDSGLSMERNVEGVPTSLGGTIENNITTYMGPLGSTVEHMDDLYSKYFFDGNVPSFAPNQRAALAGTFNAGGKLSRAQFEDEVTRAIWQGFEHDVPEVVAAAKEAAGKVFEPILKEAQAVGLMPEDVKLVGDRAYASRIYNVEAIQTRTAEFVKKIADNYEKQLNERFGESLVGFQEKVSRQQQLAEDLAKPADVVDQEVTKFREELKAIDENLPEEIQQLEAAISRNRATATAMRANGDSLTNEAARKQLLKDARDMEKEAGDGYKAIKTRRGELRRRLTNLNKSVVATDAKRAAKLDRIARIEDLNLDGMQRLVKKAQTTLRQLDRWTDAKLDDELENLKNQFESVANIYDRGEERLAKLAEDDAQIHKLGALEDVQTKRAERLDDISGRIDEAEKLDRDAIREAIQYGLDKTLLKIDDIARRRVLRRQRLQEEVAKLDPAVARERQLAAANAVPTMVGDFARKWEALGGEGVDPSSGVASFSDIAKRSAEEIKDTIVGTYLRLPYSEVLAKERGSELVRVLDIPSREIDDFLEKNVNKVMKTYVRTMAPDIEITRKYGSLDWRQIIKPAVDELNGKIDAISKAVDKEGKPRPQEWKDKQTRKLNAQFSQMSNNFEAVMQRLRGTRGLPSDPDGFAYRAARTIMNLNVLRMMGMVTVSSLPDLGRPIMRYGLTRTFRDGFGPLIKNLQAFKMNAREARLSGAAMDTVLHTRAMAVRDIADDMQRGSKFEKGVEWATNRMGVVALFDYWTEAGKLLTSSITNAKLMESLAKVVTNEGDIKLTEATKFLAENGIDGDTAGKIWDEVAAGGGGKVNGTWWPNTESWKDQNAVRIYRAALAREINNTIITPGVEKPLLADANVLGRMLYQFKSFGMSSTPKLMIAGIQQRDASILSGSLASMGLGALSYYLWAVATGGKAYTEMQNAGLDKWADEAMNRSGIIAGAGEVQRIAQNIPLLANYASFSGTRQTRRPGDDLVEALLGPSFDFAQNSLGVIGQLHDPTQATIKQFARLLPYQNAMVIREAIDAVTHAIGEHLPERRK